MTAREYPERPNVGVGVVIWRGEEVLLVQRARPPRVGQWSLPGGRQKLGETVREAGLREVREETGLDVEITELIDVVDSITRDAAGRVQYQYVLIDFAAEWRGGEAVAGTDAGAVRWVHKDRLGDCGLWRETLRVIALSAARRAAQQYTGSSIGAAPPTPTLPRKEGGS